MLKLFRAEPVSVFFGSSSVRVQANSEDISSGSVPPKITVRVRFSVRVQVHFDTLVTTIICAFIVLKDNHDKNHLG